MNRLDKLKAEIAEMDAGEFARWLNDYIHCNHCIYGKINANCHDKCVTGMREYLEHEYVQPKTLADVFFERNPGAEKNVSGQPKCCAKQVGLINDCPCANCADCWNIPYEESNDE